MAAIPKTRSPGTHALRTSIALCRASLNFATFVQIGHCLQFRNSSFNGRMRTEEVGGHTLPRIDFPSKRVHDAEMGRSFPDGLSRLNRMLKLSEGARQSKGIARQFRSGCVREVFPA